MSTTDYIVDTQLCTLSICRKIIFLSCCSRYTSPGQRKNSFDKSIFRREKSFFYYAASNKRHCPITVGKKKSYCTPTDYRAVSLPCLFLGGSLRPTLNRKPHLFLALPSPSPAFLSLCPPRHSCLFRPNFLLTAVVVVQFGLGCPVCRFIRYHTNVGALLKGISYYAATDKRHGLLSSGKWKKKHSPSSLIYLVG